jgi:hypothetical protein
MKRRKENKNRNNQCLFFFNLVFALVCRQEKINMQRHLKQYMPMGTCVKIDLAQVECKTK